MGLLQISLGQSGLVVVGEKIVVLLGENDRSDNPFFVSVVADEPIARLEMSFTKEDGSMEKCQVWNSRLIEMCKAQGFVRPQKNILLEVASHRKERWDPASRNRKEKGRVTLFRLAGISGDGRVVVKSCFFALHVNRTEYKKEDGKRALFDKNALQVLEKVEEVERRERVEAFDFPNWDGVDEMFL